MASFTEGTGSKITSPKQDTGLFDSDLFAQAEMKGQSSKHLTNLVVTKLRERGVIKTADRLKLSDFDGITSDELLRTKWIGPKRLRVIASFFDWDRPPVIPPGRKHPHRAKVVADPQGFTETIVAQAEKLIADLVKLQYTVTDPGLLEQAAHALQGAISCRRALGDAPRMRL